MRLLTFVVASVLMGLVIAAPAAAGDAQDDRSGSGNTVRWEDFDDPNYDPSDPGSAPIARTRSERRATRADSIELGPMGVDAAGIEGRIHMVAPAETLWDISEAYLGTPWVWPSVWHENEAIENPHVIEPGDLIWITSTEMRHLTDEEADELLSTASSDTEVAGETGYVGGETLPVLEDDFDIADFTPAAIEDEPPLPVAEPLLAAVGPMLTGEIISIPANQDANFTAADTMETATSIVDAPSLRRFLTQGDEVHLALGEGEVAVGDQFTVFREVEAIRDHGSARILGYHLESLGWIQVHAIDGESSIAVIHGASVT